MFLLPAPFQLNILKLYEEEIISRISVFISQLDLLKELIKQTTFDEILNTEEADDKRKAEMLWKEFINSPMKTRLYPTLLKFLSEVDKDLHSLIYVESYKNEYISGFLKLLKNLPEILENISSWDKFSIALIESVKGISVIVDRLVERVKDRELSEIRAIKLLLRIIPALTPLGYEHVLFAVTQCGSEALSYVKSICPNFENEYELLKYTESNQLAYFYQVLPGDDIKTVLFAAMRNETTDNMYYAKIGRISQAHYRSCTIDYCKERPLNLRPYQEELVGNACKGHNVVICAPTGSGKTVISAYIIRDHIYKAIRDKNRFKVCFFVPTNSLVHQQQLLLSEYLNHCSKVRGLSGDNPTSTPLLNTIDDADIVVITPQLIVNLLSQKPSDGFETSFVPFDLSTFTLIIFDEAHHTRIEHPYNTIMGYYHEMKLNAFKKKNPQIIGMTASLGVGGSSCKDLEQAIKYVLSTCANLDVYIIDVVRVNIENLNEHTRDIKEETIFVELEEIYKSRFFIVLKEKIEYLKAHMLQLPEALNDDVNDLLSDKNGSDCLNIAFSSWVYTMKYWVQKTSLLTNESRKSLGFYIDIIINFYNAITMTRLFGAEVANSYLEENFTSSFFRSKSGPFVDELNKTLVDLKSFSPGYSSKSPLLNELIEVLRNQFKDNGESRVIIFLQQREFCTRLSQLLNQYTSYSTSYIVGKGEEGQNNRDQQATIKSFAEGRIKILCATTVAEEGLDISACNLVIQYNYVTHEIARVQRKGRARAKNARSILLSCDAWIQDKEDQNKLREKLMNEALVEVGKYRESDLKLKISKLIEELNKKRIERQVIDEQKKVFRRELTKDHDYFILCSRCDCLIGHSTEMFVVSQSQYVLGSKDLWKKVKVKDLPEYEKDMKMAKMASPIVGDVKFVYLFVFLKSEFKGQKEIPQNSERIVKKKWKEVYETLFYPDQIPSIILVEMKQAELAPDDICNANV